LTVAETIEAMDPAQPETLDRAEDLVRRGRMVAAEVSAYLDSSELVERWAAVYYFSRLAEPADIPALAAAFEGETDVSNRATIAGTLLRLGDERGLPVLQDALDDSETPLAFSEPPQLLSDYARRILEQLKPDVLSAAGRTAAAQPDDGMGVFAMPLPAPALDITVTQGTGNERCVIRITLNLQFRGGGATQALVDSWVPAILAMWNNQLSTNLCVIQLTVNTKVGGDPDPNYAQITVVDVPPGGRHRSNMTLGHSGVANDLVGEWDNADSGAHVAHELGHALGVDDEYKDNGNGGSEPVGEAATEHVGRGKTPSIMAQTWNDRDGDAPSAKPRHIDAILKAYGINCDETCTALFGSETSKLIDIFFSSPTPAPTPTFTPIPVPVPTNTPTAIQTQVPIPPGQPVSSYQTTDGWIVVFRLDSVDYLTDGLIVIDAHIPFCEYIHVHGPPIQSVLPGPDGQPFTRSEHLGECGYGPPNFFLVPDPRG
jgi:hypothetical protein